jgi:tRNA U34 5-methylaminomethyl-2-thiouridine-forming methyltransferase MnmC
MQKCYDLLLPGGILSTYCAQGQFKRNLKSAGFQVETIPGPPGKKEMVRAQKPS